MPPGTPQATCSASTSACDILSAAAPVAKSWRSLLSAPADPVLQTANTAIPPACSADYFDGLQAAARPVQLTIREGRLHIDGEGVSRQEAVRAVSWPERQRHGRRQAYLPGHGMLSCADAAAWDAWARANGLSDSRVVRAMQSWRWALVSALAIIGVLIAAYRWGTPLAAELVLAVCPPVVDETIGTSVMASIEKQWLQPTKLTADRQAALRTRFEQAVQRSQQAPGAKPLPAWSLNFRSTPERGIGANAFAIPGGQIIVTDAMVELLADRPDVLMGVLGHELGHVQRRHGMRMLVQATLLAALSSAVIGDFSSLLTAAPALLGQMAYSRGFEFEADESAARLMRANGSDPADFALLFERMAAQRGHGGKAARPAVELPIGLSSHPPDAERVKRIKEAGR